MFVRFFVRSVIFRTEFTFIRVAMLRFVTARATSPCDVVSLIFFLINGK